MKKDFRRKLFVVAITAFLVLTVSAGTGTAYLVQPLMVMQPAYTVAPLMVMQPAYTGMHFYVYQPAGIPVNWYATLDGYPVCRGADGVWFYGAYSNYALIRTNYMVGHVVPAAVCIQPYYAPVPQTVVYRYR